jgi:CW-type Zinc Finger
VDILNKNNASMNTFNSPEAPEKAVVPEIAWLDSSVAPEESDVPSEVASGNDVGATLPTEDNIPVVNQEVESDAVESHGLSVVNESNDDPLNIHPPMSKDSTVSMESREEKSSSPDAFHAEAESTPAAVSLEPLDVSTVQDAAPVVAAGTSKAAESELNPSASKEAPPTERIKLTLSLKRPAPVASLETEQPPTKKLTIRIPIPKVKAPTDPATNVALSSKGVSEGKSPAVATAVVASSIEGKSNIKEDNTHRMELDGTPKANASSSPRQLKKLEKKRKKLLAAASKNVENVEGTSLKNDQAVNSMDGLSIVSSKKSTVVANDDKLAKPGDGLVDADYLDGSGRSERRAAQHANEHITAKSDVSALAPSEEGIVKKKKKANRRKEVDGSVDRLSNAENEVELDDSQWVQCDKCGKWRIIPNSVVQLLPTQWYCADNVYDPKHASCEAPEQTDKDVAREKKKRLKKKQRLLKAAEEAASNEVSTPKSDNAKIDMAIPKEVAADRSPRPPRETKEEVEKQNKQPKRPTPQDETQPVEAVSDARPKKEKKVTSLAVKRGRSVESLDKMAPATEEPAAVDATKPRGRGRPRRVNNPKEASTVVGISVPTPTDDGENLEWVQCEKCDKWRKLPPHVSADDLPDVWTCDMNNWNPSSASCDAPEDKSEGLQDIGVFGSSGSAAGKWTYRHLIFGSNGRRANRPVSEKTRAAESIFAAHLDEDDAPSKVLYSDSSVYVSRGRASLPNDENEGMSVLELMSHSQLWQELRGATWSALPSLSSDPQRDMERMNTFVYDTLPVDIQDLMKEYVLQVLDSETLFVDDILQRALSQNTDSLPRKLQTAHAYCSENVVVTTLCELVKTGRAECIKKIGSSSSDNWNPCYRRKVSRVMRQNDDPSQLRQRSAPSGLKFSHLMKLSKPWKRPQWRQLE